MRRLVLFALIFAIYPVRTMDREPFMVIDAAFQEGDYRRAVMRALEVGTGSPNGEEKRDSMLFLKEFFPAMILEDQKLDDLWDNVSSIIDRFDLEYGGEDISHMMFILDDWARAKYHLTGRDHWKNVPSMHFDYSDSDYYFEEEADLEEDLWRFRIR